MSELRERWEGVSLPGDYLLTRWVSSEDNAGIFDACSGTEAGPDAARVTVKLVPQTDADGSAQLGLWQRTKGLEHPHLRRLLDFGRAELDGQIVLYAVLERADDTLAAALRQGPLSEPEAREVLGAALSAMRYLQAQGLAVSILDPDHVVAVGENIKVCTHGLREVPADMPFRRELAAFWDQVSPSPTAKRKEILREALGEPPEVSAAPLLRSEPKADAVFAPPLPPASSNSPYRESRPADEVPFSPEESPHVARRTPRWIFVGAAAVVLLILGWNFWRSPDGPAQAPLPTPVSTTTPPRTVPPVASSPVPAPSRPVVTESKPSPRGEASRIAPGKAMWRVIAFTYRSEEAARHKVKQVNEKHPDLKAGVFSPREKKGYYLVALGGRMTRDDAIRVQRQARAERLAHDVYIQNYLD
ncbi:MAG: SPOR domain-containing protein [Candidatus Solibacter sp.]